MAAANRWARADGVLSRLVLDDAVILTPGGEEPFALARGANLWSLLDVPRTVDDLAGALADRGAGPGSEGKEALAALLDELAGTGALLRLPS